jgi:hypothetical protein
MQQNEKHRATDHLNKEQRQRGRTSPCYFYEAAATGAMVGAVGSVVASRPVGGVVVVAMAGVLLVCVSVLLLLLLLLLPCSFFLPA